ncbi:zf-HC2 domain-containing protein [Kitasatospora sp. RB6PN24]|uniref:zf-HC2 domain-containing protein n=1 Tax=Kitasatospora humi TaxID=2893891 RepID=UPI001E3E55E2|nr:zf-HC2 domain-containing protein [Kitasatospora humi]MCC9307229.1 zf-HC2 domain-containing protein [Kitasatospora humi]
MTESRFPTDPIGPDDPHLDVGAYVLGLLDGADRAAFEAHLADCPRCRAEAARLEGLQPLLAEYAAGGAEPVEPSARLLDGLLDEVASRRRRQNVRRRWLVAVAAALVLGGPAVTAAVMETAVVTSTAAPSGPSPTAPATGPTATSSATGPGGAVATVGVAPSAWGSTISLTLSGVTGPRTCDLVAVSEYGAQQTVTTWTVPASGYGGAAPQLHMTGGTGYAPGDLSHFEVRDLVTGQLLVSVPAPAR